MHKILATLAGISMVLNMLTALITPHHHVICIDPGHGGDDPGAVNSDITEAEETLDIAKQLKSLLEAKDYKVVMTREDSTTNLTNSERAALCNKAHSEVLVSIHLNSGTDSTLDYTQALYGTSQKDKQFAQLMHKTLVSELGIPSPGNDGVTDFHDNLLLKAKMPATLQETIFLSNPSEYQKLTDETGVRQKQIAQALFDGINKWFEQLKTHKS